MEEKLELILLGRPQFQLGGVPVTGFKSIKSQALLSFLAVTGDSHNRASLAGLLGATAWGLKVTFVFPPDAFEIHYTVEAIIIVLLGGAGTLLGPIVGGLIYGLSKYWLAVIIPGFQLLIFAPIILFVIVAFPEGVIGTLKRKTKGTALERYIL